MDHSSPFCFLSFGSFGAGRMSYQWITLDDGRSVYRKVSERTDNARSSLPVPMLIRDEMSETEHPCDGRSYTSKSAFRAVTKAHGCVEVGNGCFAL